MILSTLGFQIRFHLKASDGKEKGLGKHLLCSESVRAGDTVEVSFLLSEGARSKRPRREPNPKVLQVAW